MLSELEFAAALTYSPRGQSERSKASRTWTYGIKQDRLLPDGRSMIAVAVAGLRARLDALGMERFLGPGTTLVPAPCRAPHREGWLWPAQRICEELVKAGLGREVLPCVRRRVAVPKSAFAAPGERPDVHRHLDSMLGETSLVAPEAITVVDDIVTKGATLLAVASHVSALFPGVPVRAFALVRTMGLVPEVDSIAAPCTGWIRLRGNDVVREP